MKIAVLTGGGVAPGMNAAIRAVTQAGFSLGWEVMGVEDSYNGLLEGRLSPIDRSRLGGLMHRGGTVLGTGRSKEVREPEGQERAARRLEEAGVGGLVVIGGGGRALRRRAAAVHQRSRGDLRSRPYGGGAHPVGRRSHLDRPDTGGTPRGRGGGGSGRRRARHDGRGEGRRDEAPPAGRGRRKGAPARPGHVQVGPDAGRDARIGPLLLHEIPLSTGKKSRS
jgi:Phosphofructokinase